MVDENTLRMCALNQVILLVKVFVYTDDAVSVSTCALCSELTSNKSTMNQANSKLNVKFGTYQKGVCKSGDNIV